MDTAKVANLFTCYPDAELLDFVNAPIGKGIPVDKVLRPLLAVPTTAGTGSETTGTAIFDHSASSAKTGIASRALRPLLGIVDPLNTETCPVAVHISAGLDVLFHALEVSADSFRLVVVSKLICASSAELHCHSLLRASSSSGKSPATTSLSRSKSHLRRLFTLGIEANCQVPSKSSKRSNGRHRSKRTNAAGGYLCWDWLW